MCKLEIHPVFQDLEIVKMKTYLPSATAITVVEDLQNEVSLLNVLHGIVVGDDTGKFEIDDITKLTVAKWLLMLSTQKTPLDIIIARYLK